MEFITLNKENIEAEHICCAFSDKKCTESYREKKEWLKDEFEKGYVFRRLDERAKVFMEYGPAEMAWLPLTAPGWLNINCFWVSGKYKKQGLAKSLLNQAEEDARSRGCTGLITVAGRKKNHFMSDGKWFLRQGFELLDSTETGFVLLGKRLATPRDDSPDAQTAPPRLNDCARGTEVGGDEDLTVYYSNRCPYAGYHVENSLAETAEKRGLTLKTIKLTTCREAQKAPTPATLFSLFYKGRFVTTDISVCMDSRFDKIVKM